MKYVKNEKCDMDSDVQNNEVRADFAFSSYLSYKFAYLAYCSAVPD